MPQPSSAAQHQRGRKLGGRVSFGWRRHQQCGCQRGPRGRGLDTGLICRRSSSTVDFIAPA